MEIKTENDALTAEMKGLNTLLGDEGLRWKSINGEVAEIKKAYGLDTELGRRHTIIGKAPTAVIVPLEAMIEREPVTIVCSDKGWVNRDRLTHTENQCSPEGTYMWLHLQRHPAEVPQQGGSDVPRETTQSGTEDYAPAWH